MGTLQNWCLSWWVLVTVSKTHSWLTRTQNWHGWVSVFACNSCESSAKGMPKWWFTPFLVRSLTARSLVLDDWSLLVFHFIMAWIAFYLLLDSWSLRVVCSRARSIECACCRNTFTSSCADCSHTLSFCLKTCHRSSLSRLVSCSRSSEGSTRSCCHSRVSMSISSFNHCIFTHLALLLINKTQFIRSLSLSLSICRSLDHYCHHLTCFLLACLLLRREDAWSCLLLICVFTFVVSAPPRRRSFCSSIVRMQQVSVWLLSQLRVFLCVRHLILSLSLSLSRLFSPLLITYRALVRVVHSLLAWLIRSLYHTLKSRSCHFLLFHIQYRLPSRANFITISLCLQEDPLASVTQTQQSRAVIHTNLRLHACAQTFID